MKYIPCYISTFKIFFKKYIYSPFDEIVFIARDRNHPISPASFDRLGWNFAGSCLDLYPTCMQNSSQIGPTVSEIKQFKIIMPFTFWHRYISETVGPIWLKFCMQLGYKSRQLPAKLQPNRSRDTRDVVTHSCNAVNSFLLSPVAIEMNA